VSNRTLLINKLFEWRAEFRATVSVAAPKILKSTEPSTQLDERR